MNSPQSSTVPKPSTQGLQLLLCVVAAVAFYFFVFVSFKPQLFWMNPDFCDFYRAGKMVLAGDGARVYDPAAQEIYDERLQSEFARPGQVFESRLFVFAPYSLLVFTPLALLPYKQAEVAWYALNVGILLGLPLLLRRRLGLRNTTVALGILLPPFFFPVDLALMHGQPVILLLLLFTLVFLDFRSGHHFRSGCMLALATIKPQFVLPMLLIFVLVKQWKVFVGFASACLALGLLSVGMLGWRTCLVGFPNAVLHLSLLPGKERLWGMPNVRGVAYVLLQPVIPDGHLKILVAAIAALLLAAAVFIFRSNYRRTLDLAFSLALIATLLGSFHSYVYDLSLLVLPFILVIDYVAKRQKTVIRMAMTLAMAAMLFVPLVHAPFDSIVRRWFLVVLLFAIMVFVDLVRPTEDLPQARSQFWFARWASAIGR